MKIFKFYLQFCKIHVSFSAQNSSYNLSSVFSGVVNDVLIVFQLFKNTLALYVTSAYSVLESAFFETDVEFPILTPRCTTLTLNRMSWTFKLQSHDIKIFWKLHLINTFQNDTKQLTAGENLSLSINIKMAN